jgi:hypothetical protein
MDDATAKAGHRLCAAYHREAELVRKLTAQMESGEVDQKLRDDYQAAVKERKAAAIAMEEFDDR